MGYFSSGTEGMDYQERWCMRCVHSGCKHGCPVMRAQVFWNYDECNKPDSILHKMIPRTKDGLGNEECFAFQENTNE